MTAWVFAAVYVVSGGGWALGWPMYEAYRRGRGDKGWQHGPDHFPSIFGIFGPLPLVAIATWLFWRNTVGRAILVAERRGKRARELSDALRSVDQELEVRR